MGAKTYFMEWQSFLFWSESVVVRTKTRKRCGDRVRDFLTIKLRTGIARNPRWELVGHEERSYISCWPKTFKTNGNNMYNLTGKYEWKSSWIKKSDGVDYVLFMEERIFHRRLLESRDHWLGHLYTSLSRIQLFFLSQRSMSSLVAEFSFGYYFIGSTLYFVLHLKL